MMCLNRQPIKFSIVIAVYNAELYLSTCLDSVINQTLEDIEILCINDGSTDSSLDILNEYAKKDKRVRVFSQLNSGPAKARNLGLENAHGEYLWFVDADDWCELNACADLYESAQKNNKPDVIGFASYSYNASYSYKDKHPWRSLSQVPSIFFGKNFNAQEGKDFLFSLPSEAWSRIFERNFVIKNKIEFNANAWGMDDGIFLHECFLKARNIFYTNSFYYVYRERTDGNIVSVLYDKKSTHYLSSISYAKILDQMCVDNQISKEIQVEIFSRTSDRFCFALQQYQGFTRYKYFSAIKNYLHTVDKSFLSHKSIRESVLQQIEAIIKYPYYIYRIREILSFCKRSLGKIVLRSKTL